MAEFDVRWWALRGAERRLVEIAEEAKAIFRHFPELRGKGRGFSAETPETPKAPARRRRLSAAARKRISDAQKARWAKVKAEKPAATGVQRTRKKR